MLYEVIAGVYDTGLITVRLDFDVIWAQNGACIYLVVPDYLSV